MKDTHIRTVIAPALLCLTSCMPAPVGPPPASPAERYADAIRRQFVPGGSREPGVVYGKSTEVPLAGQMAEIAPRGDSLRSRDLPPRHHDMRAQLEPGMPSSGVVPTSFREYQSPLAYGEPGVTASLWREARADNELVRDHRAFQPMDLITILIREDDEGKKEADTESTSESSIEASITGLLGLEGFLDKNANLNQLLKAETTNEFEGEGSTNRKGELTGTLSAMVVEVLPSGMLRIEGEKVIAVNGEEETMRISGLVRPRDVTANNEVESTKVGNLRVDYFGRGTVGEAQQGGWLGRFVRHVWPF